MGPNDILDYRSLKDGHLSQIEWVVTREFLGNPAKGEMSYGAHLKRMNKYEDEP